MCVWVYMCMYVDINIYMCVHIHVHTHTHARAHIVTFHTHAYMHASPSLYTCTYVHTCYTYMCVCMYIIHASPSGSPLSPSSKLESSIPQHPGLSLLSYLPLFTASPAWFCSWAVVSNGRHLSQMAFWGQRRQRLMSAPLCYTSRSPTSPVLCQCTATVSLIPHIFPWP